MSVMSSTGRLLAAAGVAVAFATAPVAAADPADLVPVCTGDENPRLDNCSEPGAVAYDIGSPSQMPHSSGDRSERTSRPAVRLVCLSDSRQIPA